MNTHICFLQKKFQIPLIFIASAIAGIAVWIYCQNLDFSLTDITKALPSEATFEGIDISKRSNSYFIGLLIFVSTFLATFLVLPKKLVENKWLLPISKILGILGILFIYICLMVSQEYRYTIITWVSLIILQFALVVNPHFWQKPTAFNWKFGLISLGIAILAPINLIVKAFALVFTNLGLAKILKTKSIYRLFLNKYVYPFSILLISLFTYTSTSYTDQYELFEKANPANSLLRVFKFGEIPFIDFLSSHLLSEQVPIYLYSILFGYKENLESFQWLNLFLPFAFLSIFYFLKKILNSSAWSFVIVLIFPFLDSIFPLSYWFAFVSIFLFYKYFFNPTFKNALWVFLWTIFLVFWRIDVAAAHIPALSITILIYIYKCNFNLKKLFNWVLSSLLVLAISGIVFYAINKSSQVNLFDQIKQALSYFSASQSHGYAKIAHDYTSFHFIAHHFIFPCIVLLIFISTVTKWNPKGKINTNQFIIISIIFLSLYYFFNAPRGLVRHSFFEGSDRAISSFFYLIISLFAIQRTNKLYRKWVFILVSSLLVLVAKFGGHTYQIPLLSKALSKSIQFYSINNNDPSLDPKIALKKNKTDSLALYLKNNLKKDETFFDFSNTPMLYFYTQKRVPSYFNQSLQNETTPFIQQKNIEQISQLYIPLVVFSHYPDNWWDNTDAVPNAIRYPILAKWIYKNYQPDIVVAGYQIWRLSQPFSHKLKKIYYARNWHLGYYPSYLKLENTHFLWERKIDVNKKIFISNAQIGQNLKIEIEPFILETANRNVFIEFGNDERILGTFCFYLKKDHLKYVIPIWTQYNWHLQNPTYLKVYSSTQIKIKAIGLYQDEY